MVDSSLGWTDLLQVGQRRGEPGRAAEPNDRDMGQPRATLAPVHAEGLEAAVYVVGERDGVSALVGERDHADASGLSVAGHGEDWRSGRRGRGPQLGDDGLEVVGGPGAEEGERDVEVVGHNGADVVDVGERVVLPRDQAVNGVAREHESEEEARSFTATDASSGRH